LLNAAATQVQLCQANTGLLSLMVVEAVVLVGTWWMLFDSSS
jgi:hypothetical protein